MEDTYENSYTEILEILKYIPAFEYNKIPKEKILFYEQNKNKDYKYTYDVKNPKTLKKTDAIIVNLYRNYIASEEEKTKIDEIIKISNKRIELEKVKNYSTDISFNNIKNETEKVERIDKTEESRLVVKNHQPWYKKIWNKIINMFH